MLAIVCTKEILAAREARISFGEIHKTWGAYSVCSSPNLSNSEADSLLFQEPTSLSCIQRFAKLFHRILEGNLFVFI